MNYVIAPDILLILLSPGSTFDQRKAAAMQLATDSWERGWNDCADEVGRAVALAIAAHALEAKRP